MKTCAFALVVLVGVAPLVAAQTPGSGVRPAARPAFSPYLNLNRPGASAAVNYFGMVRPQLTYNAAIQQLQTTTQELQQQQRETATSATELPPTGHSIGFLNHQRFFLRGGRGPSPR
jgi:hypothetical protein